jgi:hypothetical protein
VPFSSEIEDVVQEIVDDPTVNQDLSVACGGSLPCLVDGVCGSIMDAVEALDNEQVIAETQVEVKTSIFAREQIEVVEVVAVPEEEATTTTTTTPPTSTETADNVWCPAWGRGSKESVCLNDGQAASFMFVTGENLYCYFDCPTLHCFLHNFVSSSLGLFFASSREGMRQPSDERHQSMQVLL